ncbi:cysteine desulfurase family protein [Salsipaludibacter albus]|uniref:cysteine desulfurase family protein n=1 Tax=Salsipaludibacter albus TaxID=2849650 RepID=UPI001EE4AC3F|nr:cysteine desulfurase family protein [Salsipaludibacter albus]MBY5163301.1 cysteine desulfurase [Salsipaludibacter albus]
MLYLDHAASTPVRPEARAALHDWLDEAGHDGVLGNPSAMHAAGRANRVAVEQAREAVAHAVGAAPADVVFTSGGTEADNLAVKGLAWAAADAGRHHLVTTAVEHAAVRNAARWLAEHGFTLTEVAPGRDGRVDVEEVVAAVTDDTAVVSVMAANNEVGSCNDLDTLAAELAERPAVLHTDAIQAFATRPVRLVEGLDAISLSGHKFGAPPGVGAAVLRRGVPVQSLLHGGGQDRGVRSGTFAAALDAALGAGVTAAVADRDRLVEAARRQTDHLRGVAESIDGVHVHGASDPAWRLPTHLHLGLDGVQAELLTFGLDQAGLCASTGSACSSGGAATSHVVSACGIDDDAVLRLSVGWTSTDEEVARAGEVLVDVVARLRAGQGLFDLAGSS